jgi:hypothetical protein
VKRRAAKMNLSEGSFQGGRGRKNNTRSEEHKKEFRKETEQQNATTKKYFGSLFSSSFLWQITRDLNKTGEGEQKRGEKTGIREYRKGK